MRIRPSVIVTIILALGCTALVAAQETGKEKAASAIGVEVVSLKVSKGLSKEVDKELRAYLRPGTEMTLLLVTSKKQMIAMDLQKSKLTAIADDKGTDLTKGKGLASHFKWLGMGGPDFTADGHHGTLSIRADGIPAAGAKSVVVKGSLVILCGGETKEAVQKDLPLAKGSKLTAGPVPMTIESVEDDKQWKRRTVEFKYNKSDDTIKKITFTDAAGKEIEAETGTSGRFSMGAVVRYSKEWYFPLTVKQVNVKVEYYADTSEVTVPLDLSVGVGLGGGGK